MTLEKVAPNPPVISTWYFAFVVALYVVLVGGMAVLTVLRHCGY